MSNSRAQSGPFDAAYVAHPCLSSLDSGLFFEGGGSSHLQEIGKGGVAKQVASEVLVCDVPAKTEKKRIRA